MNRVCRKVVEGSRKTGQGETEEEKAFQLLLQRQLQVCQLKREEVFLAEGKAEEA